MPIFTRVDAQTVDELSDRLRDIASNEAPEVQAAALAYSLAAVIGEHASSRADVEAMVRKTADTMRDQIATFGIGVKHP